jgi:hypothetical protein
MAVNAGQEASASLIQRVMAIIGDDSMVTQKTEIDRLTTAFAYVGFDPLAILNKISHVSQQGVMTLVVLGLSRGSKFKKAIRKMTGPGKIDAENAVAEVDSMKDVKLVETGTPEARASDAVTIPRIVSLFPYLAYDWLATGRQWVVEVPWGEKSLAGCRANFVTSCLEPGTLNTFLAIKVIVRSGTQLSATVGSRTPVGVDVDEHAWTFVRAAYISEHFVKNKHAIVREPDISGELSATLTRDLWYHSPSFQQFRDATQAIIMMEQDPTMSGRYRRSLAKLGEYMADIAKDIDSAGKVHVAAARDEILRY